MGIKWLFTDESASKRKCRNGESDGLEKTEHLVEVYEFGVPEYLLHHLRAFESVEAIEAGFALREQGGALVRCGRSASVIGHDDAHDVRAEGVDSQGPGCDSTGIE